MAIGGYHTLVSDEDGVVWAFGKRRALGLDDPNPEKTVFVKTPAAIPTLRVRALKYPSVGFRARASVLHDPGLTRRVNQRLSKTLEMGRG